MQLVQLQGGQRVHQVAQRVLKHGGDTVNRWKRCSWFSFRAASVSTRWQSESWNTGLHGEPLEEVERPVQHLTSTDIEHSTDVIYDSFPTPPLWATLCRPISQSHQFGHSAVRREVEQEGAVGETRLVGQQQLGTAVLSVEPQQLQQGSDGAAQTGQVTAAHTDL